MKAIIVLKGGPGSGHHGHEGRPGKHGGSLPGDGSDRVDTDNEIKPFGGGTVPTIGRSEVDNASVSYLTNTASALLGKDVPEGEDGMIDSSSKLRGEIKQHVITTIAERSGLPEKDVNAVVKQWAKTSNGDYRSLSLQQAISEELGVPMSEWQESGIKDSGRKKPLLPREQERQFVRAMYESTQETLAAAGFKPMDKITLYRGYNIDKDNPLPTIGEEISYIGNAAESWSSSPYVANMFADYGVVIAMDVPIRNVIGSCVTGFGCYHEAEFIITASVGENVARIDNIQEPFFTE